MSQHSFFNYDYNSINLIYVLLTVNEEIVSCFHTALFNYEKEVNPTKKRDKIINYNSKKIDIIVLINWVSWFPFSGHIYVRISFILPHAIMM